MENKKIVEYSITRYEDGSIEVRNVENSGAQNALEQEDIYNDICDVAKIIDRKRTENAAYVGARMAIVDFYAELQRARGEEEAQG